MQVRRIGAVFIWVACLSACAERREESSAFPFASPRQAETEAYVRAIEAGMAHAERVQELRRSAARQDWRR